MPTDPVRPFEVESPPKAGIIRRLLGRVSREAAFVEVRNILATTTPEHVQAADVANALAKARLRGRDATKELLLIFEHSALLAADDRVLSEAERRGLGNLQQAFELTDAEAACAIESAVGQVFERALREALSDAEFTEQEKATLEATSATLGMSDEQTKRLYKAAALSAVQSAFTSVMADRRYTNEEEARVATLAKSLGVTMTHDAATATLVAKFKLMAQIDDGCLPSIAVPILLKRGETCHFSGPATQHQIKTVTKRIN